MNTADLAELAPRDRANVAWLRQRGATVVVRWTERGWRFDVLNYAHLLS